MANAFVVVTLFVQSLSCVRLFAAPWTEAREFQKTIYSCFIDYAKALTVWITTMCGKFLKRWEYQTILPISWEICMQDKRQQLEPEQTGSKLGKKYLKAV